MQLQTDVDNEEEYENCSDDILANEYLAASSQEGFQLGFNSSKPSRNDRDGN
jgi:hypothetical protein